MGEMTKRAVELHYRNESPNGVLMHLRDLIQRRFDADSSPLVKVPPEPTRPPKDAVELADTHDWRMYQGALSDNRRHAIRAKKLIDAVDAANKILNETALPKKKAAKKGRK
jgi:hypothetical protein